MSPGPNSNSLKIPSPRKLKKVHFVDVVSVKRTVTTTEYTVLKLHNGGTLVEKKYHRRSLGGGDFSTLPCALFSYFSIFQNTTVYIYKRDY